MPRKSLSSSFLLLSLLLSFSFSAAPSPAQAKPSPPPRGYSLPLLDLSGQTFRRVLVDREKGQYLGHVTTVLLEDGRTIIAVYPKGHGRGGIVMKRSSDGGLTWSKRLPVPKSWATSKEVPTIYRTVDARGKRHLILFSGLYPIRMAHSEDDGRTWSELAPIGDYGGIVAMASLVALKTPGWYLAFFHDDGRFLRKGGKKRGIYKVYQVLSKDGGLTWGPPRVIAEHPEAHLCEPGAVRSPDGHQIALLLRENSRRFNSFVIFSNDEGKTWSKPRQVTGSLTGDRHTFRYAPDGRLVATFRDTTLESPTKGDWVAWVGRYEDILQGKEGQYRVRLMDNKHRWDCAYPGLEVLPDGTFVAVTYGHWKKEEKPYIVSVRFDLDTLDRMSAFARAPSKTGRSVPVLVSSVSRVRTPSGKKRRYAQFRAPAPVVTRSGRIVLICQGRNQSPWSDRSGQDLVCTTSDDGGAVWSPPRVIVTHGNQSVVPQGSVYDAETNRIFVLYNLFPWDYRRPPVRTETGRQGCRQFLVWSADEGETWSRPREITAMVGAHGAAVIFGSGRGIQLRRGPHKGRLILPGGDFDGSKKILCFYSDDHGKTWKRGKPVPHPAFPQVLSETKVAELGDGALVLNNRDGRVRRRAFSADGGVTWTPLEEEKDLPSVSCNASLLALPWKGAKAGTALLYSGPMGPGRTHGYVALSLDGGRTWPRKKILVPEYFGYSSLVLLPGGKAGIFYESRPGPKGRADSILFTAFNPRRFFRNRTPKSRKDQKPDPGLRARLERLNQAKFGIFIHWGPYCVLGGQYKNGPKTRAEWIQLQEKIPADEYEKIARTFDPEKFDARRWARLFKAAGARYVVITSKHHDGFCMFDTKETDYDIVDFTPFKRDPLKELARACREEGLKLGFYYSIVDWHHPEFPANYAQHGFHGRPNPNADIKKYARYQRNQVKELLTNYGPVFVIWFDGGGSFRGAKRFELLEGDKLLAMIRRLQPECLVNRRLGKGDYGTPEQRIPGKIQDQAFEVCMTIGRHWGYNRFEKKFKSARNLIRKLIDIAHKGGNFLLNVGPKPDGTIPKVFRRRLLAMGKWLKVNGEAIYGTKASPFEETPWGRCTCRRLPGGKIRLYLHVFERPDGGILRIPPLARSTKALSASLLTPEGPRRLPFAQPAPGKETRIQLPPSLPDPVSTTVILDIR